jgi:transposase
MAKQRERYEAAFKDDAVRLVQEKGRSVADVARTLGLHVNTLHGWVRTRASASGAKRVHRNEGDEAIRRLERELRRVTGERDILKTAVGFFANERK